MRLRMNRRSFLAGASAALVLGNARAESARSRPKIAALVTEYRKISHAQRIVDRFLEGYGWESRHHRPAMDVVSLYVDQLPANDLSRERAKRFPMLKIYPTIAEALTRGGSKLAVDGVLLIGEHGKYPKNQKGQTLYPRYEFFKQIIAVYRQSGRTAPVFNDKHLSWKWEWAKEMVDTAKEIGFVLMAGSSVPVTWRVPPVEMPLGAEVEEALSIGVGGVDSYDFHALEAIQCMVERRRGGETGVVALQALRGDVVWKAMKAGSWAAGGWDPALFGACLCRSFTLNSSKAGYSHVYPAPDEIPRLVKDPVAYRYEYADGLKATMLLLNGLVSGDITFAARLKSQPQPLSTQMYLPGPIVGVTLSNFFNPLVHHIENLFLNGRAPYPVERTLLTTGLTAAGVESLWQHQKRLETPHLAISYQPPRESTFRRT